MSQLSSQEVIGPTVVFLVICVLSSLFASLLFPLSPPPEKEIELRWRQLAAQSRFWAGFLTNLGQAILAALVLSFFLLNTTLPSAPPSVPDAAAVADAQPAGRTLVQALGWKRALLWSFALMSAVTLIGSGAKLSALAVEEDAAAEDASLRARLLRRYFDYLLIPMNLAFLAIIAWFVWELTGLPIW